ncbi:probable basic-leucine zipper transcription factor K [Ceratitis capitata]|uniref:(Mediterranean fruit fly) hypothetical protein n=1 Tax=Ceratitis capitata TaxID=7213 RepID=A0A811U6E4_CERCA|nr:probable basic-leucine zipper transcription factor K [Ceratitis capitata]CAD6994554.1 unnamed protein product [Ceratitis capitata]
MSNLSVFSLLLIFAVSCYVPGNTEEAIGKHADDDFLQAINFANSPKSNQKPYLTIQEQQKQQQQQKEHQQQHQQQQESQHHKGRQANKRSVLATEVATATVRTRQKRSQHAFATVEEYLKSSLPTYTYNLALLNVMNSLRRQLSNIELARLRSRLSHSAAADLRLYNDIYNHNHNYNNNNYDVDSALLNVGDLGTNNNDNRDAGTVSLFGTDTGNGGLLGGVGNGDAGGVSVGVDVAAGAGAGAGAGNDMLANDIEDSSSVPWQFVTRVSKKSSALYKPRLGKRTRQQQQQQHEQQQQLQ